MAQSRRYEEACDFLKNNKLRYSRQRMVVVNELFFNGEGKKHFKLNELLRLIDKNHKSINISSASLANILKGLCNAGYLREVYLNRPYYDIITTPHMHFYDEKTDNLLDIDEKDCIDYIHDNLALPCGYKLDDVHCVIALKKS